MIDVRIHKTFDFYTSLSNVPKILDLSLGETHGHTLPNFKGLAITSFFIASFRTRSSWTALTSQQLIDSNMCPHRATQLLLGFDDIRSTCRSAWQGWKIATTAEHHLTDDTLARWLNLTVTALARWHMSNNYMCTYCWHFHSLYNVA